MFPWPLVLCIFLSVRLKEVLGKSSLCPSDKLSPLFDRGLSPLLSLFETSLARTTPISARLLCTYLQTDFRMGGQVPGELGKDGLTFNYIMFRMKI